MKIHTRIESIKKNLIICGVLRTKKIEKNSFLYPSISKCIYFIDKDTVEIHQTHPHLNLGCVPFSFLIGLPELYLPINNISYKVMGGTTLSYITFSDWAWASCKLNLEHEANIILSFILSGLLLNLRLFYAESNESKIINLINRNYENNKKRSQHEPLINFILSRSTLSRSFVFKAIKELKASKYITMKSGILVSINKKSIKIDE